MFEPLTQRRYLVPFKASRLPQQFTDVLVIGGGVAGMLFGLVWMIRIYRSDPEAHESSFRYRDF